MLIERVSPFTGKKHVKDINVTHEQLMKWSQGMLAQHAFPHLTPGEREFIMTGITEEEWDEGLGPEE